MRCLDTNMHADLCCLSGLRLDVELCSSHGTFGLESERADTQAVRFSSHLALTSALIAFSPRTVRIVHTSRHRYCLHRRRSSSLSSAVSQSQSSLSPHSYSAAWVPSRTIYKYGGVVSSQRFSSFLTARTENSILVSCLERENVDNLEMS